MKDVLISIRGTQHPRSTDPNADTSPVSVELVTGGSYEFLENGSWFTYQESELTGMDGTKTTFTMEKDFVTMTRVGAVNSQMRFQPGQKHVFLYDTPFGAMTMGVDTQRLKAEADEHGGKMDIVYAVDVDNVPIGKNTFHIDWKEIAENAKEKSSHEHD